MFPSIGRIVPEVSGPNFLENVRNSPDISKGIFKAGMCKFESSQVSQAFLFSENFLSLMRKARQMRAFFIADSLQRLVFKLFAPRTAESLQPNPRKLPFSGDSPWRR
jgi:hypothetical protein